MTFHLKPKIRAHDIPFLEAHLINQLFGNRVHVQRWKAATNKAENRLVCGALAKHMARKYPAQKVK